MGIFDSLVNLKNKHIISVNGNFSEGSKHYTSITFSSNLFDEKCTIPYKLGEDNKYIPDILEFLRDELDYTYLGDVPVTTTAYDVLVEEKKPIKRRELPDAPTHV